MKFMNAQWSKRNELVQKIWMHQWDHFISVWPVCWTVLNWRQFFAGFEKAQYLGDWWRVGTPLQMLELRVVLLHTHEAPWWALTLDCVVTKGHAIFYVYECPLTAIIKQSTNVVVVSSRCFASSHVKIDEGDTFLGQIAGLWMKHKIRVSAFQSTPSCVSNDIWRRSVLSILFNWISGIPSADEQMMA